MKEALAVQEIHDLEKLDPKRYIIIKGARVNNLKNVSVAIPRYKFVVITGLSGSGKSSLAFDTLFAEGQRMYVESLSSYARQFLGRMEKPEVDYIRGVSPAIAIEQKVSTRNPRSTVGTTTEIYDYLKLLFARIGVTYSPISGEKVTKDTVTDVVEFIKGLKEGSKIMILSPFHLRRDRTAEQELNILLSKGYTRLVVDDDLYFIEDLQKNADVFENAGARFILIDRAIVKKDDEETQFRLADSVQTAFFEGEEAARLPLQGVRRRYFQTNLNWMDSGLKSPVSICSASTIPMGLVVHAKVLAEYWV